MYTEFNVDPKSFHLSLIEPSFQDLVPGGNFTSTLAEFTLMNKVKNKAPIINIRRIQNILKRRDAGCDLQYSKVMGTSVRMVTVDELYAGTKLCKHSFYQEALKDWRNEDPLFGNKVLPFFQGAVNIDVLTNSWFGDIARAANPNAEYATTEYDGVWTWIYKYIAGNVIPAAQTMVMPAVDMRANPETAYNVIKGLYDRQPERMRSFMPSEMAIYTTQAVSDGYSEYLRSLGEGDSNIWMQFANGLTVRSYNNVPIIPEPMWGPVLQELYGDNYNLGLLTLRGNMIFGTDDEYGEGEDLKTALMIWYEKKELQWYYQQFLKAGTNIALPEFSVAAIPA